jgi:hypothetical protein
MPIFLAVLGFELKALFLLDRLPLDPFLQQVLFLLTFQIGSHAFFPGPGLDGNPPMPAT